MLNNTCRRDAYSDGRCVADASVLSELSGQRFARERTSRGLPPFVDCCTGAAVTDGAQETLEPSNADGSHASGFWCSWPRHLMWRHQVHLPGTSLLSERNQDEDMHQDMLQVCAASQSRWEWVTARAVYPKAHLSDRSGTNARETFELLPLVQTRFNR